MGLVDTMEVCVSSLHEDGDVEVGVFPEREEVLISAGVHLDGRTLPVS